MSDVINWDEFIENISLLYRSIVDNTQPEAHHRFNSSYYISKPSKAVDSEPISLSDFITYYLMHHVFFTYDKIWIEIARRYNSKIDERGYYHYNLGIEIPEDYRQLFIALWFHICDDVVELIDSKIALVNSVTSYMCLLYPSIDSRNVLHADVYELGRHSIDPDYIENNPKKIVRSLRQLGIKAEKSEYEVEVWVTEEIITKLAKDPQYQRKIVETLLVSDSVIKPFKRLDESCSVAVSAYKEMIDNPRLLNEVKETWREVTCNKTVGQV